jgi:putative transposase
MRPQPAPAAASTRNYLKPGEVVVLIQDRRIFLWRAIDSKGEILDVPIRPRGDKAAALRLLRKLLQKGNAPHLLVTDKLAS